MAVVANVGDAQEAGSAAKNYPSTAIAKLTSEPLQVRGGIGFTWEHDLHLYYRQPSRTRSCSAVPSAR